MFDSLRSRASTLVFCSIAVSQAGGATRDTQCHVDGFETPVTCATLEVPRDYDRPEGATLALMAVVIPASTGRPAPDPLLVLAGGPGQSATSLAGWLAPLITLARRERDVILFDVRGTGLSEPLACAVPESAISLGDDPPTSGLEALREAAAQCEHTLGERTLNHTNREVVEDIDRFRAARGYERINLWGGSYGTRIAQHYVRDHGEHVRAVVLDAVTPLGTSALVTGAHTPDASLAKLLGGCAADPACAAAFPGLARELDRLLAAVQSAPITAVALDPATGAAGQFVLDYLTLTNAMRVALYGRSTTEMLPFSIHAAARGDYAPLLGIYGAVSGDASVAFGAQFSMLCAEDYVLARDAGTAARTGGFMRDGYYEAFAKTCAEWPTRPLPPAMYETFSSAVPVLAISGDRDPVTPPELAAQALKQFATSVHVILRPGFHTNSANPCVARIIASFLSDPVAGGRDHGCVATTPPLRFVTTPVS